MKKLYEYLIISLMLLVGTQAFGAVTTLIADEIYSGNYIVAADELNVPEAATGCAIYNTTVRGKLDLDEGIERGLGPDLLGGFDFTAGWNIVNNATIVDADTFTVDDGVSFSGIRSPVILTIDKIYRFVMTGTISSGSISVDQGSGVNIASSTSPFAFDFYYTAASTTFLLRSLNNASTIDVATLTIKEVTFLGGIYSSIFAEVDLAGVEAAETAEFFNCKFVEAQGVIEGTLGVGGTVWFDEDCEFSIVTATHFTNYAGDDCTLKPGSPYRHGGTYIPGYESKLRPAGGVMDDILSVGGYAVPRGSAGM